MGETYSEKVKGTLYQMFEGTWWTTRKRLVKELENNGVQIQGEEVNSVLNKLDKGGQIGTLTRKLKELINYGYSEDFIKKFPELGWVARGNSDRLVIYDTREPEQGA